MSALRGPLWPPLRAQSLLRRPLAPSGGFATSPPAVPLPTAVYLPAVGTSPAAVYGMRRLVSAYSGPLIQVQRASDNATLDVVQTADGVPDASAVESWRAGSPATISTWYDQTGNGRHAANTTLSEQPRFDAAGARGQAGALGAIKSAMFDGWYDIPSGNIRRPKRMTMPNALTYDFQAHSIFLAFQPKSALYNAVYMSVPRTADGSEATGIGTAATINGVYTSGGGQNSPSGRRVRANYQTMGFVSGASNFKILQDGQIISLTAKWTDPLRGGRLGDGIFNGGSTDFMSAENFLGVVVYPAALSDANAGAVRDALNSTFGITAPSNSMVVQVGDSIQYGATVVESLEGRTNSRLILPLLTGTPAVYNMGLSSQLLTGGGGLATNAASREFIVPEAGFTKRVLFIEIAGNDLAANGNTPGYGATLYAAMASYIGNARAAGYTHIVVRTILPRAWSTQQAIEVASYNALVRANSAGADAIADAAAHPIMGDVGNIGNSLYYQGDNVHPTGYGNELLAATDASAINAALAITPVDAFDAANKSVQVTLSENNRRMTSAAANMGAKSITSKAAGKFYFEFEIVAAPGGLGVGNAAANVSSWVGSDANSVAWDISGGNVFSGGVSQGSAGIGSGVNGNVIGVAVDRTAGKVWFSKTGSFGAGQDPVAATGGFNLPAGAVFAFAAQNSGGSCRIRTATAQFTYSPPTGYVAWS